MSAKGFETGSLNVINELPATASNPTDPLWSRPDIASALDNLLQRLGVAKWTPTTVEAPALLDEASISPYPLTITNTIQKQNIVSSGPLAYTISNFIIDADADNTFKGFSIENLTVTPDGFLTGAFADDSPFTGSPTFGFGFNAVVSSSTGDTNYLVGDLFDLHGPSNFTSVTEGGDTLTGRSITFAFKIVPNGANVDVVTELRDTDTDALIVSHTIADIPPTTNKLGIGAVIETSGPSAQFDRHFDKIAAGVEQVGGGVAVDESDLPEDGGYLVTGLPEPALSSIGTILNGQIVGIESGTLGSKNGNNDYVYAAGAQDIWGVKNFVNGLSIAGSKVVSFNTPYTTLDANDSDYTYTMPLNSRAMDVTRTYPGPSTFTVMLDDNLSQPGDWFEFIVPTEFTNNQLRMASSVGLLFNVSAANGGGGTPGPITLKVGHSYRGRLLNMGGVIVWQVEETLMESQSSGLFDTTYVTENYSTPLVNVGTEKIGSWLNVDLSNSNNLAPTNFNLPTGPGVTAGDKIIVSFDPNDVNAFAYGNWPIGGTNLFIGERSTWEFTATNTVSWNARKMS